MSIRLILSNNSVRNTTVSCDSLGLHYDVSQSNGVVTVARWESAGNKNIVVGQFELPHFRKDKVRLGEIGEWRLLEGVLYNGGQGTFSMFSK